MYTRASLTDFLARILARKSARVGQVGGQVGEDRRTCSARCKLNGEVAGHADFRACHRGTARRLLQEDPRAEVGEDVRVAVGVGPMEFQLIGSTNSLHNDLKSTALVLFVPAIYSLVNISKWHAARTF